MVSLLSLKKRSGIITTERYGSYRVVSLEESCNGSGFAYMHAAVQLHARNFLIEREREVPYTIQTPEHEGGMIVFSTDVNATTGTGIIARLRSWLETQLNRFLSTSKVTKAIQHADTEQETGGFTIGHGFRGRFFDHDSGKKFDENSVSVEIVGVRPNLLKRIGAQIAKDFNQKSVMIRDYSDNKVFFLNRT